MKIKINKLGLDINLTDLEGRYYTEEDFEKIKEGLSKDEEYQDHWFYFYKDEEDIIVDIIDGSFEIIDVINSWEICKNDPFVMIVKDEWSDGSEVGYISFEALPDAEEPPSLKGGEYDRKEIINESELTEFYELQESEEITMDVKYQEFYFVRSSKYNASKWLENWLSEDYGHNK